MNGEQLANCVRKYIEGDPVWTLFTLRNWILAHEDDVPGDDPTWDDLANAVLTMEGERARDHRTEDEAKQIVAEQLGHGG